MPEYLQSGVFIEEIELGQKPIEGVPTSTAAFVGETERGMLMLSPITSHKDYAQMFGGVYVSSRSFATSLRGAMLCHRTSR